MLTNIKRTVEKEFQLNEIDMRCRVDVYAISMNKPTAFKVDLYLGEGAKVLSLRMSSEEPFNPKIISVVPIEPKKLGRYCDIINEAFLELESKLRQDF